MEKLAKQLTIKYAFLQSTYWLCQCCIYSFAAVFLQSKNFDNVQIGFVIAFAAILSIVLQPMIASYADKSTTISLRQIVIMLMFTVFFLAILLRILPSSFLLLCILYVLIVAIQFSLNPLFNSLALEYLNQGVPLNYGLARGIGSISFAVMSSILGIVVNRFGADLLLSIFIFCYCFSIMSVFNFKLTVPKLQVADYQKESVTNKKVTIVHTASTNVTESAPTGIVTFFLKYKKFSIHLIGISMLFYSQSILNTYLINIIKHVGGNSANLGISLSIAAALELPTMAAFIFLVRKIKCSTLIKISAFFFFIKIGMAYLAPSVPIIYLSMSFQLFAFALYTPASVYYVNSIIDKKDKVKGQSMLGVAMTGIAGTVANITGGKLIETVGISNLVLVATIVTGIGFIIVFFTTETTNTDMDNVVNRTSKEITN